METPELDRIYELREKTQLCRAFLEWLQSEKKVVPCVYNSNRYENEFDFYIPIKETKQVLLNEFFGIDLKKAENERQALLNFISSHNAPADC